MKKMIIVGGGAAGMMAAIRSADGSGQVTLLEKNEKLGKKLFITGKGRCNLTNNCGKDELMAHMIANPKFMYRALYGLDSEKTMALFEEAGLRLKTERGGRVFPASDKSSDVIRTLEKLLKERNVRVCLGTEVTGLLIEDGRCVGVRAKDGRRWEADRVLLACGGCSYPSTGSDGSAYKLAEGCGHRLVPVRPSLVPMTVKEAWCGQLQGLSLKNVTVTLREKKKVLFKEQGEMLFTHFGVSGPLILSASARWGRVKNVQDVSLSVDLKPALSPEQLDARILREFDENINRQFRNSLGGLLPRKLIPVIVELSGIDGDRPVNRISKAERLRLRDLLKDLTMRPSGLRGFNEAIITAGGISVKDVDPSTMGSKHIKGLYFAGEMLDIDALTGGYNLQLAWSTGWLAGESMSREDENEL